MASFEAWDIVAVPFPYTDKATRQRRPALVISAGGLQTDHGLLWVLMITSAENRSWPGDVAIADLAQAGLPVPSVIRTAKIASIVAKETEKIGSVGESLRDRIKTLISERLFT